MIWFLHALLIGVGLTFQSVLAPAIEIRGIRPDWLLAGVVFLAMHGPPRETLLAAWVVGLAADLLTLESFGLLGVSYAVAAFLVIEVREFLFCHRAWTQFVTTAAVAAATQCGWAAYVSIRYGIGEGIVTTIVTRIIPASLYTALWAVPLHRFLLQLARPLGLASRSRGSTGPRALRYGHV